MLEAEYMACAGESRTVKDQELYEDTLLYSVDTTWIFLVPMWTPIHHNLAVNTRKKTGFMDINFVL